MPRTSSPCSVSLLVAMLLQMSGSWAAYTLPASIPSPKRMTNLLNQAESMAEVSKLAEAYSEEFNAIHLSAAWMRLSRLSRHSHSSSSSRSGRNYPSKAPQRVLRQLEPLTQRSIRMARTEQLSARAIANIAYGSARSGFGDSPLYDALEKTAVRKLPDCTPQAVANLAWAYATAEHRAPLLFDSLAQVVARAHLSEYTPQNLANLAWAYAAAGHSSPDLFSRLADESVTRLRDFTPQNLANLVWSFATLGQRAPALYEAVAVEATRRVAAGAGFNAQDCANLAWAFATARHPAPQLFDALADAAEPRLPSFLRRRSPTLPLPSPPRRSPAAGAPTSSGHSPTPPRLASTTSPRRISPMSRSLAKESAIVDRPLLFDRICGVACARMDEFSSQGLANVVWAVAKAHEAGGGGGAAAAGSVVGTEAAPSTSTLELFDRAAAALEPRVGQLSPQVLSDTAWAYATVQGVAAGEHAMALFDALAAVMAARVGEFTPAELAKTGWAFARASFAGTRYTIWNDGGEADA